MVLRGFAGETGRGCFKIQDYKCKQRTDVLKILISLKEGKENRKMGGDWSNPLNVCNATHEKKKEEENGQKKREGSRR